VSIHRLRVPLILTLAFTTLLAQAGTSLAMSTEWKAAAANTFGSSYWAYFLHNNPTPPTANTTAKFNLAMDPTAPTAATLYDYDTNCGGSGSGRTLARVAPSPTQATTCDYANWRTATLSSALTLTGNVTLDVWLETNTSTASRTGALAIYLRDYNPTSSTYTEITNLVSTSTYAVGLTWYERVITVTASYTLAVGHQLELKLEASTAGQASLLVAYDTTTRSTFLRLR
jgi:hypothetical protein